jgi:hypothetical protein
MLFSSLLGAAARAQDVSGAIENYRAQANAAALDDKCTILKPDERAVLNTFRDGLAGFIAQRDTGFAPTKKPALDVASRSAAQTAGCADAAIEVRGVYEDAMATNLAIKPALLTIAMSVGERCKAISAAHHTTLMQAWTNFGNDVVRNYSALIRVKYLLREHAAEQTAEKIPCSDAPRSIESALTLARQILQH